MPITVAATTSAGGAHRRARPWLLGAAWAFALVLSGALVTFPTALPGGPDGLRTSEIVGLAANAALVLALLSGASLHRAMVPIAVAAFLSIPWVWAEVVSMSSAVEDSAQRFTLIRWFMGLATGYWLAVLMDDERCRGALGVGLLLGLVLSLLTVVHDAATFDMAMLKELGIKEEKMFSERWIGGEYRAAGIFGHPNNAAAVVLLIVPLVIGLVEERRVPRVFLLLALAAIATAFVATKTRGPAGVAALLLFWHLFRGSAARKAVVVVALAVGIGAVGVMGLSLGSGGDMLLERFSSRTANAENVQGRLRTTLFCLDLALQNPLGLGSNYVAPLLDATGHDATHNAFLQLALMGGVPLALFVAARLLTNAAQIMVSRRVIECWVAIYMVGAFMFENLFLGPNFVLFTVWLLWRPPPRPA